MSGKPGPKRFWTEDEKAVMSREYPTGGYRAVQTLLPDRTQYQIRAMAERMQLKVAGRTYIKQPATEWIDAAICRAYRSGKRSPDLKSLAKALGRTKGWIKWRAAVLGVRRSHVGAIGAPDTPWTPEEDQLLEELMDRGLAITGIHNHFRRKHYRRSITAILCRAKMKELNFSRDFWTANDTAKALNVDDSVVLRWIRDGLLKATRRHGMTADTESTKATLWDVQMTDLRKFLVQNPYAWDHRRIRIEILLEILCCDRKRDGIGAFAAGMA